MKSHSSNESITLIYIKNKIVGQVQGDSFIKEISKAKHFLRYPPSIANDISVLKEAEKTGAKYIVITDIDSGDIYKTQISAIWEMGKRFNRGYGDQIYLLLNYWDIKREGKPNQLPLFQGI